MPLCRSIFALTAAHFAMAGAVDATPLLTDSEATLASVCLDYGDVGERLIQICEQALEMPGATRMQRAGMLNVLGDTLRDANRLDEAEARYREELALTPAAPQPYEGLGWVYRERDDNSRAVEMFRQSIAAAPTSDALAGLGAALYDAGEADLATALAYLDGALAINPENRWGLRQKGWMLRDAGRYEASLAPFRAAIDVYSDDLNAHTGLAYSLNDLQRNDEALEHINRVIALAPEDTLKLATRALTLQGLGRNAQALRDANRVIEALPDNSLGHVRKAQALAALGRRADALTGLAEAQTRLPDDNFLTYWHAHLLTDDDQLEAALVEIRRNTDRVDGDEHDQRLLTYIAVHLGRIDLARAAADAGMTLAPDNGYSHYWDAVVLLYEGKIDSAESRFRAALDKGLPDDMIGEFAEHMIARGLMLRAIALRLHISSERARQETAATPAEE